MRTFIMLICLFLPSIVFAQPSIQFDSEKYDFKEVEGKVIEHGFEFTNAGTEELVIEEVVPS
jgi:hypothetical protein